MSLRPFLTPCSAQSLRDFTRRNTRPGLRSTAEESTVEGPDLRSREDPRTPDVLKTDWICTSRLLRAVSLQLPRTPASAVHAIWINLNLNHKLNVSTTRVPTRTLRFLDRIAYPCQLSRICRTCAHPSQAKLRTTLHKILPGLPRALREQTTLENGPHEGIQVWIMRKPVKLLNSADPPPP